MSPLRSPHAMRDRLERVATRAPVVFVVLTAVFAVAAAGVMVAFRTTAEAQVRAAVLDAATDAGHLVRVAADLSRPQELRRHRLTPRDSRVLDGVVPRMRAEAGLARLVLRDRDGHVVYSRTRAGIAPGDARGGALRAAATGRASSVVSGNLIRTYVPIPVDRAGASVDGVYQLDFSYGTLAASLRRADEHITTILAVAALLAWLALLPLGWRAARLVEARVSLPRRRTLRDLERGIERGEVEVHFQPKVAIASGRTVGAEALVRWRRGGAFVSPGAFLPHVEGTPLMARLSEHVLGEALAHAGAWGRDGLRVPVAVNLSADTLVDGELPHRVAAALERHGVAPELLTLEVTETAVLEQPETAGATLAALSALGVKLSVDDFGTGHSSLSRLHLFPIDEVKIDRSFVAAMPQDGTRYVAVILRLAADLDMSVVAEGVETEEMRAELERLGCEVAQGFLFAPALPAGELHARVASEQATALDGLARAVAEDVRLTFDPLLREIREALGMDIAWVAELGADVKRFRWVEGVSGASSSFGFGVGDELPLDETYCHRVVRGQLPSVLPDTALDAVASALAITEEAGIGAYAGVPIELPDGRVYGTVCCASHAPVPQLSPRDGALLRVAARVIGQELARKELEWRALRLAAETRVG